MKETGEVTLKHQGKEYGATYSVHNGMLLVKTHTETRSLQIGARDVEALARQTLQEIVGAQDRP